MDKGVFLASVAGVSGTIAAIVGGFILAALLALVAEKSQLVNARVEKVRALSESQHLQASLAKTAGSLARRAVVGWLAATHPEGEAQPIQEMAISIWKPELPLQHEWVRAAVDEYLTEQGKARTVVASQRSQIEHDGAVRGFLDWYAKLDPRPSVDVDYLRSEFEEAVGSAARRHGLDSPPTAARVSPLHAHDRPTSPSFRELSVDPAMQELDRQSHIVHMREEAVREASDALAAMSYPSHFVFGLVLFGGMGLGGVVYPLALMSLSGPLRNTEIGALLCIVAAELLGIAAYASFLLFGLRRKGSI
jgi:hypothetical protein